VSAPYNLVARYQCRLLEISVECKRDLIASRAMLVLERILLDSEEHALPVEFGSEAYMQTGRGVG